MSAHTGDIFSAPDLTEIAFIRSRLDRTIRESSLRLELLTSECESRVEELTLKHETVVYMLHLEQNAKLALVKREYGGKIERLKCELESQRGQVDPKVDVRRIERKTRIQGSEKVDDAFAATRLEAQEECQMGDFDLRELRKEMDRLMAVTNSKDAEIRRLRCVLSIFTITITFS